MEAQELRNKIDAACKEYDSLYGQLVRPINDMLIQVDADISEKTAKQILDNLAKFHNGEKYIADCHLEESNNFIEDGMKALQNGDIANGALQMFGAGLNFASFASKAAGSKNINPQAMLKERFAKLMELKPSK